MENKKTIKINVVFLCHDGQSNFLMSLRSERARDNHNLWDPGSGKVEFGESIDGALKRELFEEYNATAIKKTFMGIRENISKTEHWITFDYLVEVDRKTIKNNEPNKFDKLVWFKYQDLPIKKSHPLFEDFLEKNKKTIQTAF